VISGTVPPQVNSAMLPPRVMDDRQHRGEDRAVMKKRENTGGASLLNVNRLKRQRGSLVCSSLTLRLVHRCVSVDRRVNRHSPSAPAVPGRSLPAQTRAPTGSAAEQAQRQHANQNVQRPADLPRRAEENSGASANPRSRRRTPASGRCRERHPSMPLNTATPSTRRISAPAP